MAIETSNDDWLALLYARVFPFLKMVAFCTGVLFACEIMSAGQIERRRHGAFVIFAASGVLVLK